METRLKFHLCETRLGWIGLVLSPRGLRATTLPLRSRDEALREVAELGAAEPASASEAGDLPRRLRAFAEGGRVHPSAGSGWALTADIDWDGISGFRRAVLEETMRIPAGETRSYGWLARRVGRPGAARAVGRVMATNPLPIVVPCHRVVASDGSLRGYGGGLDLKAALLRAEGAISKRATN
jgi:methylated-DNA-[protein]-cysteine S-methyltransferase